MVSLSNHERPFDRLRANGFLGKAPDSLSGGRGMAAWRLLRTGLAPGPWNMAVDEAMMEALRQGLIPPTLRLYGWEPPCLSLGYFQRAKDVDLERCEREGVGLVRRPTGGRAVFHHRELTYSLVLSEGDPLAQGGVLASYAAISSALLEGVRALGVEAVAGVPGRRSWQSHSPACFDDLAPHEVHVHTKKLIGSAQVRRQGILLQQGSVPLEPDVDRLCSLLRMPPGSQEALAGKVLSLGQALGRPVTWDEAAEAIGTGFQNALGIALEPGELTEQEEILAQDLLAKYQDPAWNFRR